MPFLTLAISLFVLSQSAIFIRLATADASAIGFWRLAIALPVLVLLLSVKGRWKDIKGLSPLSILQLFFCGFFLFLHFYTWFLSIQKTSVANAMILFTSNPLFTALGAWIFFKEKIHFRHFVSLVLCLIGVYFLVKQNLVVDIKNTQGDVLGFLCGILFSAYVLMGKKIRHSLHNLPFSFMTYGFCCLCFFVLMVSLGTPFLGYNTQTWGAFCGLAFGSTLLGHSLFTHSLQFFNVNLISVSTLSEPILTMISAKIFFAEPITKNALLGFGFVSAGIANLYSPYLRKVLKFE